MVFPVRQGFSAERGLWSTLSWALDTGSKVVSGYESKCAHRCWQGTNLVLLAADVAEVLAGEDPVGAWLSGATATAHQDYDDRDQHQDDQGIQHGDHDDEHEIGGIV